MNLLAIISLLSTGTSLIKGEGLAGGIMKGIGDLLSGDSAATGTDAGNFAGLLQNTQTDASGAALALNAKSSIDITQQGDISNILNGNAATLTQAASGETISNQTLDDLNKILSGDKNIVNADALAETEVATDTKTNGILGDAPTKLDDPFGIKAAEANGSLVGAAIPLAAAQSPVIPSVEGAADAGAIENVAVAQNGAIAAKTEVIKQGETPLLKIADGKDSNNGDIADEQSIFGLTTADQSKVKADVATSTRSATSTVGDKVADGGILNNNTNQTPVSAFFQQDVNHRSIGDAARAIRGKDELKEKLAEMDSYKIVNVSKKDNILDLKLEPYQMGKVQIKFDFNNDGRANVSVIADRPETLDILQKDTKSIQKILTDNGINADSSSLSFNLRSQQDNSGNAWSGFAGKPLSFRVEQEASKIAANDTIGGNLGGYMNYSDMAANGMLNIMV